MRPDQHDTFTALMLHVADAPPADPTALAVCAYWLEEECDPPDAAHHRRPLQRPSGNGVYWWSSDAPSTLSCNELPSCVFAYLPKQPRQAAHQFSAWYPGVTDAYVALGASLARLHAVWDLVPWEDHRG